MCVQGVGVLCSPAPRMNEPIEAAMPTCVPKASEMIRLRPGRTAAPQAPPSDPGRLSCSSRVCSAAKRLERPVQEAGAVSCGTTKTALSTCRGDVDRDDFRAHVGHCVVQGEASDHRAARGVDVQVLRLLLVLRVVGEGAGSSEAQHARRWSWNE